MYKFAQHNNGVKFLLVAVDVLSRYLQVQPMKALYAKDAVEKWLSRNNQKRFGQTRDPSLKVNSKNFVKRGKFISIQPKTKPSRHLLRGLFDRSKTFIKYISSEARTLTICFKSKLCLLKSPIIISDQTFQASGCFNYFLWKNLLLNRHCFYKIYKIYILTKFVLLMSNSDLSKRYPNLIVANNQNL